MTEEEKSYARGIEMIQKLHNKRAEEYNERWCTEDLMYFDDSHQLYEAKVTLYEAPIMSHGDYSNNKKGFNQCLKRYMDLRKMNQPREEVICYVNYYKSFDWHVRECKLGRLYTPAQARELVKAGTHDTYYLRKPI